MSLDNVKRLTRTKLSPPAPGIMSYVSALPEERYTLRQVADMVGRSPETLVRWEKYKGVRLNSEWREFGPGPRGGITVVRIFTPEDIDRLWEFIRSGAINPKGGRPRKSA